MYEFMHTNTFLIMNYLDLNLFRKEIILEISLFNTRFIYDSFEEITIHVTLG